ncbi:DUF2946 domain-containing protein [Burkholderia ubonensis]|uniref:DUF2946 domain-containing protein n=1 Tax=Burkholderia ubonensis TaxID=101571 RepID=UPI0009B39DCA
MPRMCQRVPRSTGNLSRAGFLLFSSSTPPCRLAAATGGRRLRFGRFAGFYLTQSSTIPPRIFRILFVSTSRGSAMPSRCRQKIGVVLGIFAILLSVVAPTISQTLRGASAEGAHHALHAHHTHHSHHALPATVASDLAQAGAAAHHHGSDSWPGCDACPYCSLIAHTPTLPGAPVAIGIPAQPTGFAAPVAAAAFRPYTVLTLAQPRAPPVSS